MSDSTSNNISSLETQASKDRKDDITLYDMKNCIRTKTLNYELQNPSEAFIYMAGMMNEKEEEYQCINFKHPVIPKYKKKRSTFVCKISRSYDLLYGFYLPVNANISLIAETAKDSEEKELMKEVIYLTDCQREDGYVIFDNPIPLHKLPFCQLTLEYTINEAINRFDDDRINKLIYPVFLAGLLTNSLRVMPIPDRICILKKDNLYVCKTEYIVENTIFSLENENYKVSTEKQYIYKLTRC